MVLICASVTVPAGETMFCTFSKVPRRVYPRAYGRTRTDMVNATLLIGLSPRVWGNPSVTYRRRQTNEAYPRAYGEPYPRAANLYGVRRL